MPTTCETIIASWGAIVACSTVLFLCVILLLVMNRRLRGMNDRQHMMLEWHIKEMQRRGMDTLVSDEEFFK